jgi:hypothetical protein
LRSTSISPVSSVTRLVIRSVSSIPHLRGITVRTGTDTDDNRQRPPGGLDTPANLKRVK